MSRVVVKKSQIIEDNLLLGENNQRILSRKKFVINCDRAKIQIGVLGSHFTLGLILRALSRCVFLDMQSVRDALLSIQYQIDGSSYGDDFYIVIVNDEIFVQHRIAKQGRLLSVFSNKTLIGNVLQTENAIGFGPSSDKFKGLKVFGVDGIEMFYLDDSEVNEFLDEKPNFVFVSDESCDLSFLFRQRSHFC